MPPSFSLGCLLLVLFQVSFGLDWKQWPNAPPDDIPFEKSDLDIFYSDDVNPAYGGADTWYPSWGNDNNLYTPWTDGTVKDVTAISASKIWPTGFHASQGFAVVRGEDPGNLTMDVGKFECSSYPYTGRYPSASFFWKGVWYYGTYSLELIAGNKQYPCGNWCIQGPFVGFRYSKDAGKTWTEPRMYMNNNTDNFFQEEGPFKFPDGLYRNKIKFGAPHVVDLGQELEHSPDGMLYMVGHGADKEYQPHSWMQGSQVYLARVLPDHIMESNKWEFFGGRQSDNRPIWVTAVNEAKPLFTWENRTGIVTMSYIHAMKKFIMCITTPTSANSAIGFYDTYYLESSMITGPFKYISYFKEFGPQAYFVNVPSRFIKHKTTEGVVSVEARLSYSSNFHMQQITSHPKGGGYHWSLLPMKLELKPDRH